MGRLRLIQRIVIQCLFDQILKSNTEDKTSMLNSSVKILSNWPESMLLKDQYYISSLLCRNQLKPAPISRVAGHWSTVSTAVQGILDPNAALKVLALSAAVLTSPVKAQSFPAQLNLSTLEGNNGFIINGIDIADNSGASVSSAGDFNGDGFDDVIIGVGGPYTDQTSTSPTGESYIVFGGENAGQNVDVELSNLDGSDGFVINGIAAGDQVGFSVSDAGDFNGDGFDDVIIGARTADANGNVDAGQSYIVFGGANVGASGALNLSSLNGGNGFILNGVAELDRSGISVSSVGDVNGDGISDVIIGAVNADAFGETNSGVSYVVFGDAGVGAGGIFNLSSLNGANGFSIAGVDRFDNSGVSVSAAGDVNLDGVDDVIIGAFNADRSGDDRAGEIIVVFGGSTVGASGAIDAANLTGPDGALITGIDGGDSLGFSVSAAGDVNGDGAADIIFGARFADPNGVNEAGESYVLFGGANVGNTGPIDLAALDGSTGFVINGISEGDRSGSTVSGAGDVNGDGIDDVIIGAFRADPNGVDNGGESYVVFGGVGVGAGGALNLSSLNGANGFTVNGVATGDNAGYSVSAAGDVNGDNLDDIVIGAFAASPNGSNGAGKTYVVHGSSSTLQFCDGRPVTVNMNLGVTPTVGNNVILGTAGDDTIVALAGNDTICGEGGNDVINAGPGDDWVDAGAGDDRVFGLDGDDVIEGGLGNDEIVSGNGNDIISGDDGDDTLNSGSGNDTIFGGAGADVMFGQGGSDLLSGDNGNDIINGFEGDDTINGGNGNDLINGGPGNDTVNGQGGNDTIFGLIGNDTLNGGLGNDLVFGQLGTDTVRGGLGNDELFGNEGDDVISDPAGTNTINGGPGNDNIMGGNGNDSIFGDGNLQQAGNDVINGGAGIDLILGFSGADTITTTDGFADTVNGGPDVDVCTSDAIDVVFNCP